METLQMTNEIKAKVFAQYLGQRCATAEERFNSPGLTLIGISDLGCQVRDAAIKLTYYVTESDLKIVLRPLSAITDEDKVQVAKIEGYYYPNVKAFSTEELKLTFSFDSVLDFCIEWKGNRNDYFQTLSSSAYQYLQSKGYDLPNYLLGGKTLKESNLAIYE